MVHFVNELWREMEVATAARVVEYGGDRRAAPGALERVVGQKEPSRDPPPKLAAVDVVAIAQEVMLSGLRTAQQNHWAVI